MTGTSPKAAGHGETPDNSGGLYAGYEDWKGWAKPFAPGAAEVGYLEGETRDIAICGADVLEIGFGSGGFLAWARDKGARVAGSELIPQLIANARERGIEVLPPDFETVAAQHQGRFDTIVAFDVFEHFSASEIVARLNAAHTMLKPGGRLMLRFPNAQSPFGLAPQNGDPTHKSALSRGVIEQLMQGIPFDIVRYSNVYRPKGTGLTMLVRAMRRLLRAIHARLLNFMYEQDIPWDPVVVMVLKRR